LAHQIARLFDPGLSRFLRNSFSPATPSVLDFEKVQNSPEFARAVVRDAAPVSGTYAIFFLQRHKIQKSPNQAWF
jgi:hypothetical protein